MKNILNFFHINEIYVLIYVVLYKLSYLNLQYNSIPAFHRANFLSLSVKKGDTNRFSKTAKVSPMEGCGVIRIKCMIEFLTVIMVI